MHKTRPAPPAGVGRAVRWRSALMAALAGVLLSCSADVSFDIAGGASDIGNSGERATQQPPPDTTLREPDIKFELDIEPGPFGKQRRPLSEAQSDSIVH